MTPEYESLSSHMRERIAEIRAHVQRLMVEKHILEQEHTLLMTGKRPSVVLAELEAHEILLWVRP